MTRKRAHIYIYIRGNRARHRDDPIYGFKILSILLKPRHAICNVVYNVCVEYQMQHNVIKSTQQHWAAATAYVATAAAAAAHTLTHAETTGRVAVLMHIN